MGKHKKSQGLVLAEQVRRQTLSALGKAEGSNLHECQCEILDAADRGERRLLWPIVDYHPEGANRVTGERLTVKDVDALRSAGYRVRRLLFGLSVQSKIEW